VEELGGKRMKVPILVANETRTDIVYLIGKRLSPTEFDLADA
jgi:hypothetical protein